MYGYGISALSLIREFLLREGVCDRQRACQLASMLERELCQEERLESEDGTTFVRTAGRCSSRTSRFGARQLGFGGDVDERHPNAVDPISMTSRLDRCS